MIGYEKLTKSFKHLYENKTLSHSYIFFGEPQVGKFSFATALATYFETEKFESIKYNDEGEQITVLTETLVISPDEKGTIGIDEVRNIQHFLSQKPINSSRRVVIIDNSDSLTMIAQHAILKIAEEPPENSLLILITNSSEVLLQTVQSRFQKIYFPRIKKDLIVKLLEDRGVTKTKANSIADISFGRPGMAIELSLGTLDRVEKKVQIVLDGGDKRAVIESMIDNKKELESFFTYLIAELAKDPIKNYYSLRSIIERKTYIQQFTTNKRLQLEEALWTI